MYENTKTWNPFVGCKYNNCIYCKPSFQSVISRFAKLRAKRKDETPCPKCLRYEPHIHPERLSSIPSSQIVFVCGDSDIYFCDPSYVRNKIIPAIKRHIQINLPRARKYKNKQFYFQSKNPICLKRYIPDLMPIKEHVIFITTLETNRDAGYSKISKAPPPSKRYRDFLSLDYPRKVITIEPVMDFDMEEFLRWILSIKPEYIWIGYNSRPKQVQLPEPSENKLKDFIISLWDHNIEVKPKKNLRGLKEWFKNNNLF